MLVFISIRCSESPIVDKDTTPPEVYILAPVTGSVVGEVVSILAYAEDNEGIDGVEFLINDTLSYIGEKIDTLYALEWNSTNYENREYKLQAVATDLSENSSRSLSVRLVVDNSNSAPRAQNISNIVYDRTKMTITWEPSNETDLAAYEVLISESYNGNKTTLATINDSSVTSYTTTDFNPGVVRYYWLKLIDIYNFSSIGNGYRLIDDVPTSVNLDAALLENGKHKFLWNTNTDSDFVSYTLSMIRMESTEQDTVLYFSNSKLDTSYTAPFILTENFYQITVKDYWDLSSKSNILEVDFGPPPIIINTSTPDTITRPGINEDSLYLISAQVTDENGLATIDIVGFTSYILIADSIRGDSTFFSLFDDGGMDTLFEAEHTSGDTLAGDGRYCNQILVNSQMTAGTYDWVFIAKDINLQSSDLVEVRVVIQ